MGKSLQRIDEQAEGERVAQAADFVKRTPDALLRIAGQQLPADEEGGQSDGDVDEKQPVPRGKRQDGARHRRSGRRRHGHHHGVQTQSAPQVLGRIDEAEQGRVHAHDARAAEALQQARHHQHGERLRTGAQHRGRHEQRDAGEEHPPVAVEVAQRGKRQEGDGDNQLIGVDNPDGRRRRDVELVGKRRQCHVGYGDIQYGHDDGQQHGGHTPVFARNEGKLVCHSGRFVRVVNIRRPMRVPEIRSGYRRRKGNAICVAERHGVDIFLTSWARIRPMLIVFTPSAQRRTRSYCRA